MNTPKAPPYTYQGKRAWQQVVEFADKEIAAGRGRRVSEALAHCYCQIMANEQTAQFAVDLGRVVLEQQERLDAEAHPQLSKDIGELKAMVQSATREVQRIAPTKKSRKVNREKGMKNITFTRDEIRYLRAWDKKLRKRGTKSKAARAKCIFNAMKQGQDAKGEARKWSQVPLCWKTVKNVCDGTTGKIVPIRGRKDKN